MADKINKLSTAIRLGATFPYRQCKRMYISYSNNNIVATCALGGAAIAAGMNPSDGICGATIGMRFPNVPFDVITNVVDQNDRLGWTREQIADDLEKQGY